MIKLIVQNRKLNDFTNIDKFALIPKKWWDYFDAGDNFISLNNIKMQLQVFEVPCTCVGSKHTHRILDLRKIWDKFNFHNHQTIEISK